MGDGVSAGGIRILDEYSPEEIAAAAQSLIAAPIKKELCEGKYTCETYDIDGNICEIIHRRGWSWRTIHVRGGYAGEGRWAPYPRGFSTKQECIADMFLQSAKKEG